MKSQQTEGDFLCFLTKAMLDYFLRTKYQAKSRLLEQQCSRLTNNTKQVLSLRTQIVSLLLSNNAPDFDRIPIARASSQERTPEQTAAVSYIEA